MVRLNIVYPSSMSFSKVQSSSERCGDIVLSSQATSPNHQVGPKSNLGTNFRSRNGVEAGDFDQRSFDRRRLLYSTTFSTWRLFFSGHNWTTAGILHLTISVKINFWLSSYFVLNFTGIALRGTWKQPVNKTATTWASYEIPEDVEKSGLSCVPLTFRVV